MPGTHHIRFLVDGSSKIAEDLPTAVDDNGTLANYVAVPISGHTPPSATLHPASRDALNQYQQQQKASGQQSTGTPLLGTAPAVPTPGNGVSFFADAEAAAGKEDGAWTDRVPWQLECAAEEEEQWLSYSHSPSHHGGMSGQGQGSHPPPPPQHPQAPSLPRHLEKLIMNQRMPSSRGSSSNSSGSKSASKSGSGSGAGSGGNAALSAGELPVTTASGTNLSASTSGGGALGMTSSGSNSYGGYGTSTSTHERAYGGIGMGGLADDNSVLPVPSHVVLHHLGTSAIRNGVLAVADTVRYKKKVGSSELINKYWEMMILIMIFSISRRFIISRLDYRFVDWDEGGGDYRARSRTVLTSRLLNLGLGLEHTSPHYVCFYWTQSYRLPT